MLKRIPWLAAAVLLVALSGASYLLTRPNDLDLNGTSLEDPANVQDVALVNAAGESVRLGDWRGDMLLVFFGYANCPDVCPLTMAKLADTYRKLGAPENVQVIMVTVDPERDTPEALQRFVEGFHPDFVGLTGTPEQVAAASSRFYAAGVKAPNGEVAHSSHVSLVDPKGRLRVIYNQDKLDGLLQEDLEMLLARSGMW